MTVTAARTWDPGTSAVVASILDGTSRGDDRRRLVLDPVDHLCDSGKSPRPQLAHRSGVMLEYITQWAKKLSQFRTVGSSTCSGLARYTKYCSKPAQRSDIPLFVTSDHDLERLTPFLRR